MGSITRVAAVLLLPALVLAAVATIAAAGEVATFDTKLTISSNAPAFHGKVKSDSDLCVADRKIKLYRKRRGSAPRKLLGEDRSNGNGFWAITEPDDFTLKSGIYFAKTRKILDQSTPLPTFCERDKTRKLVVD